MSGDAAATVPPPWGYWWGNAGFALLVAAVGAGALWPIYRDDWFWLTAASASAASLIVAALSRARRWRLGATSLAYLVAYFLLALPLAAPDALTDLAQLPDAALGVLTAPVTGVKNLLTLDLPVGTYQQTLGPALLLFLLVPGPSATLAASAGRRWVVAGPIALVPAAGGILLGPATTSPGWRIGPIEVTPAALLGLSAIAIIVLWYLWRAAAVRRLALRRGAGAASARAARARAARLAIGTAILLVAVITAGILTPVLVVAHARTVPRTGIDPVLRIEQELSPLSTLRENYRADTYDRVLFRVSTTGGDRVRMATLSFSDGVSARIAAVDSTAPASFARVPSALPAVGGTQLQAEISLEDWDQLWVPLVGDLEAISFTGPSRGALTDGFFYSAALATGVELSDTFGPGTVYSLRGSAVAEADPATATAPNAGPSLPEAVIPESLLTWIGLQDVPATGAGLIELIDRLRERGYLSHALTEADAEAWLDSLDGGAFSPSRAGHSTDRIDDLFAALVDRQLEEGGKPEANLVAGVGDDEQFAVAAALIADQLGFPARIVVGARLSSPDPTLPVCEDGACRGGDVGAWIEVQDVTGIWIPIDTTPQHTIAPDSSTEALSDPQNATDVDGETADTVLPPEADPADTDTRDQTSPPDEFDAAGLWLIVQIGAASALVLLVVISPLLAILALKAHRRRRRRTRPQPAARVAGGWDEWVDAAADHGAEVPSNLTRSSFAAAIGHPAGATLAAAADRASFAPSPPTDGEAARFWDLVDEERGQWRAGLTRRQRLAAALSLRSLRRR
ncbi:hypothetical protein GCM10009808_14200 [Microbacterium sediminicola]|uniref:Transglutaminase-like domain-containing protein n=1 Tax=Microbacterium sediminicola TaxID=415210 RepID=A0ABN2I3B5_9MICO